MAQYIEKCGKQKAPQALCAAEACRICNYFAERAMDGMRDEGYIFPLVIALSTRACKMEFTEKAVLKTAYVEAAEDDGVFYNHAQKPVNRLYIVFRSQSDNDEKVMVRVARRIAAKLSPDAICFFMPVLYRVCGNEDNSLDMRIDPDAVHMVHAVLYLPREPRPAMRFIPYVDRGSSKDGTDRRDVRIISSSWCRESQLFKPHFPNPYRNERHCDE